MRTTTALAMLLVAVLVLNIIGGSALAAPPAKGGQGKGKPAQGPPHGMGGPPPMTPDSIVAALTKELGLSKTQQDKLKAIYTKQFKDMEALRTNESLTHEQRGQKMGEIFRSTDKAMRAVLTPAQIRKLDDRELNGLTKMLGLSEAQRTKIRPILDSRRKQMEALWNDKKLTPQQKMEKGKTLYESSQAQIKKILTPEQQKKLAAMFTPPQGPGGPPPGRGHGRGRR